VEGSVHRPGWDIEAPVWTDWGRPWKTPVRIAGLRLRFNGQSSRSSTYSSATIGLTPVKHTLLYIMRLMTINSVHY